MEIARFVAGVVLLIASALLAVQLWSGRWLSLIAKPEKTSKKGTWYPEGTMKAAKRVAWVMVACFAVVGTLMAFEMGKMAGSPAFTQVATILCNIALVAYCVCLVWTAVSAWKGMGGDVKSRLKGDTLRLGVFLVATCVAMTAVSLLFV